MPRARDLAIDFSLSAGAVLLWAAPVLARVGTHLHDGYDALFHAWNLAWIRHALATAPLHVLDANDFAPLPRTLAYSDPFLGCGLLSAPFAPFGPVAALNLTCLLLATLSLFAVVRFARSLGASRPAALVGAAAAGLGPLVATSFGYLPFPAFGGIALLALAWRRLLLRARWRDAALLGLAAGLFGLLSLQLLAFAAAGVAVLALVDVVHRRASLGAAFAARVLVAAGIALLLLAPVALALLAVRRGGGLRHSAEEMLRFSATLGDWSRDLYPGTAALLLALVGVAAAVRRRPPLLLAGGVLALAGFALAFGPKGPGWLLVHGPAALVFGSIRSFTRFGFVAQTGLALLAAAGVDALATLSPRRDARVAIFAGAALLTAWSVLRGPGLPFRVEPRAKSFALADTLPSPVLHLPFRARASDARYLFGSIPGFHPLVNGYTSFNPPTHEALSAALQERGLGEAMLRRLAAWPVRTLVVHEHALALETLAPTLRFAALGVRSGALVLVAEEEHHGGVDDVLVFGPAAARDPARLLGRAAAARDVPDGPGSDFLASVDEPAPGAFVRGPLVVRGWSRTESGPTEILDVTLDQERRSPLSAERTPRPDACAVFPKLGDCSRAGYAFRFAFLPGDTGPHELRVTFLAADGRYRTETRAFTWEP